MMACQSNPYRIALATCKLSVLAILVAGMGFCGCATTPTFRNPFAGPPPAYKTQYGLSPAEKAERLRQLAVRAPDMTEEEQDKTRQELCTAFGKQSDPILRREIIIALGYFPGENAVTTLKAAIEDADPKVRIAACRSWARQPTPAAFAAISSLLATDTDTDVRLAACDCLGAFQSPEAIHELAAALDDRDPALQIAAIKALKSATGQDVGNNINEWIEYVAQNVPRSSVSGPTSGNALQVANPTSDGGATLR